MPGTVEAGVVPRLPYLNMTYTNLREVGIEKLLATTWLQKSGSLCIEGRYGEAITAAENGIKLDPGDSGLWTQKGHSQVHMNMYEDAFSSLLTAISFDPKNGTAWYNLAVATFQLGRRSEGIEYLNRAGELGAIPSAGGL
jgi:tetratricopeptide (TPR) repeat protein